MNETLCRTISVSGATENATNGGNCNTLQMVTGKPFGKTKIGARIMSMITVGGHEVTRNLRSSSKSNCVDNRYTEGYGPHEVK